MELALVNQLRKDLDMSSGETKYRLKRTHHFETQQVKHLEPKDVEVKEWLDKKGHKAFKLHREVFGHKKSDYAERYGAKRQEQKWRRLLLIQEDMARVYPDKSMAQIRMTVRKVARFGYGEVKNLTIEEHELRDVILKHNIKPATLNNWMLYTVVPKDFKVRLEAGLISTENAKKQLKSRERRKKAALEICLLEDARRLVREVL